MSTESSTPPASSDNGKTIAVLSYITLIGWIVALVMNNSNKTKLGAFHLRQMLGLMLFMLIASIIAIIPILGWIIFLVAWIASVVFWIMGLIAAIKGEQKPVPVVGAKIQSIFGNLFE